MLALAVAALTLAAAGCNSEWVDRQDRLQRANTTPPGDYRADILAFMRTYLNDPGGVRGAFVSPPALQAFDGSRRYISCLRYNARKSNGQYAGSKDVVVLFQDGRLDRIVEHASAKEACEGAAYQPFPELERLTR